VARVRRLYEAAVAAPLANSMQNIGYGAERIAEKRTPGHNKSNA